MDSKDGENSDARVSVEVDMNEEWKSKGGSIWTQGQERSTTRVKCRATTCQLVQLVKFMEKHKELAVSHTQPFPGSEQLWGELAEHINQFGPPKNPKQCKTTWRDLRKRAFAMMRSRNKDKTKATGRNLYGMAPKIISLITAAEALPKPGLTPASEASSSQTSSPNTQRVEPVSDQGLIKVERTSSGDQLVIRVTDKLDSKTNVFNRFSVSDGHFENNIIVKEEREDPLQDEEESSEQMEPEVDRSEHSQGENFPAVENIVNNLGAVSEGTCKALRDLNETFRRYVSEYSDRTVLMRERLELDRARLQFDMEVFRSQSNKRKNDQNDS